MDENDVNWDFSYRDGFWQPTRTPSADEKLRLAAETLAISFGKKARTVELFLEALAQMESAQVEHASVNTTTAYVRTIGSGDVEICDKYGQFANSAISVSELNSMLSALIRRMVADFPDQNPG